MNVRAVERRAHPVVESAVPSGSVTGRFLRDLQNPLVRNGLLLTLSSGSSALIGFAFWAIAAHRYSAASVGSNAAAIALMGLAAAASQLNLSSAMTRFVPAAGSKTARLVAVAYAVCGCLALLVAGCIVLIARAMTSGPILLDTTSGQFLFVIGTVAATLFVLQDGVLTALRRTPVVPLENIAFALAKVVLVVILAAALPNFGIFVSWTTSLAITVPLIGVFLFLWAIPRQSVRDDVADTLPPVRQVVRYVAFDYVGALCSVGWILLLPVLVLHEFGPVQTAYFSIAAAIANAIYLANTNLGTSLVVETASDQSELARKVRQVLVSGSRLVIPTVLIVVAIAPFVLGIFGAGYSSGSGVLRLLVLAALPNLVIETAISSARAQRRLALLLSIQVAWFILTIGLSWVLLHAAGLSGAGIAVLLSQTIIAGVLLLRRDLWAYTGPAPRRRHTTSADRLRSAATVAVIRLATVMRARRFLEEVRSLIRERSDRGVGGRLLAEAGKLSGHGEWTEARVVPTVTDVTVAMLKRDGEPTAVLKVAESTAAAAEFRSQYEVLVFLAADARLGSWRRLLPQTIAYRSDSEPWAVIEKFCPRVDLATVLARHPDRFEPLTTAALASIDEFHLATGELCLVDDFSLQQWVDVPLGSLAQTCRELSPEFGSVVGQLGVALRSSLAGHVVLASWIHGDYHPANVMLAGEHGGVTGIVDWGGSRPARLSVLDDYMMVLSASCVVERSELGTILARRLRAGGLAEHERRPLEIVCAARPDVTRGDRVDERGAILLTWLHHCAELFRQCGRYDANRVWWTLNVVPVLETFTEVASDLEADVRAAELAAIGAGNNRSRLRPAPDVRRRA